ncbi:MAG TPA: hypothetical protein PK718_04890 [Candidatus Methanofastidiosa archaeon]|nr:hypothetical protein [Candidatus Methanofastidiosa archaeon]
MEEEDRSFYLAIIVACIIGIIIISYTIVSSPKYEENFTELYFYGEKVGISDGVGEFGAYEVSVMDGAVFLTKDGIELGPYVRGSTLVLEGDYWYLEDVSDEGDEMLFRKLPLEAPGGSEINGTYVIANHKNTDITYTATISTPAEEKTMTVTVNDGDEVVLDFSITIPVVDIDALEKTDEYEEEMEGYTRLVESYGDFKKVSLMDDDGIFDEFWRAKVSISLNTGEEIHVWIILDDE